MKKFGPMESTCYSGVHRLQQVTPGREAAVLEVRGGEASDVRVTAYHS